jgi:hypothetical protein
MKKGTLTAPWGHIDPIKKKSGIKAQLIKMFFPPNNILQHGLYSNIDKQTRLFLETFKYTEADREIYRKWITESKQYSTKLYVCVSDYFTDSVIICGSNFYSWHRLYIYYIYIYINNITWKVLWGPLDPKWK